MFIHDYPYTNFQEMNLDWLLNMIKKLEHEVSEFKVTNMLHFEGAWDVTKQYTKWSLVDDGGTGYVSIVPVPAGVPLDNTDYWIMVANYSSLYASFQLRVVALEGIVGDASSGLVKDVADLENTVGDASGGLVKDVTDLGGTVSDLNDEVVNLSGDVAAAQGDITALENTVGDSSAGLVKEVNDSKAILDNRIWGAIRPTMTGFEVITDSGHQPQNIQNISIVGNAIRIDHSTGGNKVGFLNVTPDEAFAECGLVAGASVGVDYSLINMYCHAVSGALVSGTGTAANLVSGYNYNVNSCVWDSAETCFHVTLSNNIKALTTLMGATVTAGRNSPYIYKTSIGADVCNVYVFDSVTGVKITPTANVTFSVNMILNPVISPNRLITNYASLSSFNLWVDGQII